MLALRLRIYGGDRVRNCYEKRERTLCCCTFHLSVNFLSWLFETRAFVTVRSITFTRSQRDSERFNNKGFALCVLLVVSHARNSVSPGESIIGSEDEAYPQECMLMTCRERFASPAEIWRRAWRIRFTVARLCESRLEFYVGFLFGDERIFSKQNVLLRHTVFE